MRPAEFFRLFHILRVASAWRLDELSDGHQRLRALRLLRLLSPLRRKQSASLARGARIRLALQELGPIFVKFGQILSTRRDLLPRDIADELAKLQDQVEPFPGPQARDMVEQAYGKPISEMFAQFETEPLASASIAQVHEATLHDGSEVVVKVLRPGVAERIRRDVDLLFALAHQVQRWWGDGRRLRPVEVVEEFETTIFDELDLQREAANCSLLKRNWDNSPDLYVPEVYWSHTRDNVFVMERIHGVPISDVEALKAAGVNMAKLSERGAKIFYTQVFSHNFFHADMHPGNILVSLDNPEDPSYLALDFGIMGSLSPTDQRYLAENFLAFFDRDYLKVAELHIESGWVPSYVRADELEAAIRTVCEPNFAKPLSEISFGEVLMKLFKVARRFDMVVQPQLVLLQKTLLNIEGLGRELYPELDLWATAQPILTEIMEEKRGIEAIGKEFRNRLPAILEKTPEMPGLLHEYLSQATQGTLRCRMDTAQLESLQHSVTQSHQRILRAVVGGALGVCATLVFLLAPEGWPRPWGYNMIGWGLLAGAALCLLGAGRPINNNDQ